MAQDYDCIVCGSCVVDLVCKPVALDLPIGAGVLHHTDPVVLTAGGITSNAGAAMSRLGARVGVLSYVGRDAWADVVRSIFQKEGVDDQLLLTHPQGATSTTMVAVDPSGERSFLHCVGAPRQLDAKTVLAHLDVIGRSRFFLLGYYSFMPNLEADLPELFKAIAATGCKTAMDAAGEGGGMQPLDRTLPHLDVYVPSHGEAKHQTGHDDPEKIIAAYRDCGAPGILGVKLGAEGVMLSPSADEYLKVPAVTPPGDVVDTTGAGDNFYGGLIVGLNRGMELEAAGRLGTATAAYSVTAMGGIEGGRNFEQTAKLAGLV